MHANLEQGRGRDDVYDIKGQKIGETDQKQTHCNHAYSL